MADIEQTSFGRTGWRDILYRHLPGELLGRLIPGAGPDREWETATAEELGLDGRRLAITVEWSNTLSRKDFHALLVARHGKLVFENYFNGHGPHTLTDIRSAGKSVTSASSFSVCYAWFIAS